VFRFVEVRIHLPHNIFYRLIDEGEERLRVDADPEGENHERHERGVLAQVQVRQILIGKLRDRTEHDALVQPQQVRRPKHYAKRAPGSPGFADLKCALENGELSDETVQ